jgi:protein-histidine pros-kinase
MSNPAPQPPPNSPRPEKDVLGGKPIVDLNAALLRLDGNRELLADFIEIYFEDSPGLLIRLREAAANDDARELQQAAHSLKGLLGNFSAEQAVAAASRLEAAGKSDDRSNVRPALEELLRCVEQVERVLRNHLR